MNAVKPLNSVYSSGVRQMTVTKSLSLGVHMLDLGLCIVSQSRFLFRVLREFDIIIKFSDLWVWNVLTLWGINHCCDKCVLYQAVTYHKPLQILCMDI